MTDKVKGFTVTLEKDIRIDDIEPLMTAINLIKGVASVKPSIAEVDDTINQSRVKHELREKMFEFIKNNML